jgi:competence/damage-inducible protein CinA-like protein
LNAPEAVVVAIGEEVLRGEVTDTNSAWLGERLSALGFRVAAGMTVADREPDIIKALRRAVRIAPVTVVTGGLGPTGDDLSVPAAARFAGVDITESPEAVAGVARRMKCAPEAVTDTRRKMALVPAGAKVYPNPEGSAPGIHLSVQNPASATRNPEPGTRNVFLLPGVPREMKAIFDESIAPALEELFPDRPRRHARLLHVSGWPESQADNAARETLSELLSSGELELGTKLGRGWVSLRVAAEGQEGAALVDRAAGLLSQRFGDSLWGEGTERLEDAVARRLGDQHLTLSLAESCTGGMIASRLVSVPGISASLVSGLVTYSNQAKIHLLGVSPDIIERYGAVSAACAKVMANGLRTSSGADITLAVTGIAGPDGGHADKPVGTVHFAVSTSRGVKHEVQNFGGSREWVRERAAGYGLWLIWRVAGETTEVPCSTG